MTQVTLYTKPDCTLCDEALAAIERVRRARRFELRQVDITADETLQARYGERVPVVALDGTTLFELHVDERRLEELVSRDAAERAGQVAEPSP